MERQRWLGEPCREGIPARYRMLLGPKVQVTEAAPSTQCSGVSFPLIFHWLLHPSLSAPAPISTRHHACLHVKPQPSMPAGTAAASALQLEHNRLQTGFRPQVGLSTGFSIPAPLMSWPANARPPDTGPALLCYIGGSLSLRGGSCSFRLARSQQAAREAPAMGLQYTRTNLGVPSKGRRRCPRQVGAFMQLYWTAAPS